MNKRTRAKEDERDSVEDPAFVRRKKKKKERKKEKKKKRCSVCLWEKGNRREQKETNEIHGVGNDGSPRELLLCETESETTLSNRHVPNHQ